MMEKYITTATAAEIKNTSRGAIVRWIANGWLKDVARVNARLWLVSREEVVSFEPPRSGPRPKRKRSNKQAGADAGDSSPPEFDEDDVPF